MSWEGTTMRSKTSFFNGTLFWKSVRRFWPLWVSHLAIWFLILPLPLLREARDFGIDRLDFTYGIYSLAKGEGLIMGFIFAVLAAMAVWSFLYGSRSAGGMACLPVGREAQFGSALLAGFLPLAAGLVLTAALTLPVCLMQGLSPMPLLAFLAVTLLILLYFTGFATLCAQLTGHILILPAVYIVLSFAAAGVEFLLRSVMSRFVYGLGGSFSWDMSAFWLSPLLAYFSGLDVVREYSRPAEGPVQAIGVSFHGWSMLLVYAAVGLVFLVLALLLFRRRRMETAGDVVAVGFLRPVFRWCMALGCGLVLASLVQFILFYGDDDVARAFPSLLVSFLIGAFIGWFSGEMLMKKTFRVFRGRIWLGFGVCCAVILAMMLGMKYDLFGYERRIPRAEQIDSVIVQGGGEAVFLTEPESVAQTLELHRAVLADKALNTSGNGHRVNCELHYILNSGRELTRSYDLAYDQSGADRYGEVYKLQELLNCREAIRRRKDTALPVVRQNIDYAVIHADMPAAECAAAAGLDGPEEYILIDLRGLTPELVGAMGPARRRAELQKALDTFCPQGWEYGREYRGPEDLEDVWFSFSLPLSEQEAEELYRDCIQPDIEAGSLGRIWLVDDAEYRDTVCSARIEINLVRNTVKYKNGDEEREYFYTVPTALSRRTNAWLEERGVILHTVGERP